MGAGASSCDGLSEATQKELSNLPDAAKKELAEASAELQRLPPERLALFIDLPHQPVYQRFSWYRGAE